MGEDLSIHHLVHRDTDPGVLRRNDVKSGWSLRYCDLPPAPILAVRHRRENPDLIVIGTTITMADCARSAFSIHSRTVNNKIGIQPNDGDRRQPGKNLPRPYSHIAHRCLVGACLTPDKRDDGERKPGLRITWLRMRGRMNRVRLLG
jgi:hypothetical protein